MVTIVIAVNAVDSLVMASDSATTQGNPVPINTWNSANKIFNLRKDWPIGAATWGQASIGGRSIATLAKELRCRFGGERPDHADWALDKEHYTIADVADRVKSYFYDEHYVADPQAQSELGLAVAGFSAGSDEAELFTLEMTKAACKGPAAPGAAGKPLLIWWGQTEAIVRLANGVSGALPQALLQLGVKQSELQGYVGAIRAKTALPLVWPGMPIGETIDLAEFLVETTTRFVRFAPGGQVVGGPVEIAAMTRHEGFKWIKRKHHFPQNLNPGGTWP